MSGRRTAARAAALVAGFAALMLGVRFFLRISYDSRASILLYRAPVPISGDEPHYLLVVNSLLFDHDLDVRPDYERVAAGGIEAGSRFRGSRLDHHTYWFDRATRRGGRVTESDPGPPGPTVVERSAHPIGFPAVVASVLGALRTRPSEVEDRAELFVTLLAVATVFFTCLLARTLGAGWPGSILACGLLLLASPWLPYSQSFYSETLQGFLLATAVIALARRRAVLAGLILTLGITVKPALAIVPASAVAVLWIRERRREAVRLSSVVLLGGLAFAGFNFWQTGRIVIIGTTDWAGISSFAGVLNTWIDPAHGVLLFAPWIVVALLPLAHGVERTPEGGAAVRPLMAASLALVAVLLSAYAPLGGDCYGPRYWVPFLPWLAAAAGLAFERGGRGLRISLCALAIAGAAIALPGTLLRGAARNAAPFRPAASLVRGFPRWSRQVGSIVRLHLRRAGI